MIDELLDEEGSELYIKPASNYVKLSTPVNMFMLAKERIYGKDQNVEVIDANTTILSCKMQNKENILEFVLGFGSNCEVLEPEWLKEKVFETVDKIYQKYEKEEK